MSKRPADGEETAVSLKKVKRDGNASESGSQPGQLKKDGEGNVYLDLGNMKRAIVSVFRGTAQVNIREFYTDQNGDVKPGKKGIALNQSQWDLLVSGMDSLSEKLKTVETEKAAAGEPSKKKKKGEEKTTKTKKEKPAQKKKKKKEVSEEEGSGDE